MSNRFYKQSIQWKMVSFLGESAKDRVILYQAPIMIRDRLNNSPDSFGRVVARKAIQSLKYSHTTKETVQWIAYRIF